MTIISDQIIDVYGYEYIHCFNAMKVAKAINDPFRMTTKHYDDGVWKIIKFYSLTHLNLGNYYNLKLLRADNNISFMCQTSLIFRKEIMLAANKVLEKVLNNVGMIDCLILEY